jgi:deoxyhypusine monooxygenase
VYTSTIIDDENHCLEMMARMEEEFEKKNEDFFVKVIREEPSLVLRVHAVTILAELGGEKGVAALSDVLLNDPDPLVRHEAAFSMGQIGLTSANAALERAVLTDAEAVVRHESAAALGSIGSQSCAPALTRALKDRDEIVINSAKASLFNLRFLASYSVGGTARERAPRP